MGRPSIQQLPKAELHLHLETSLRLCRLADRAGCADTREPYLISDPKLHHGYDRLRRLRYLGRAARVPDSLYTIENIARITEELIEEAATKNVRYVEVRVGGRRGFTLLGVRGMLQAVAEGRRRGARSTGVASSTILTVVRERGPEEALELVEAAASCEECGVAGLDISGDEANFPPALFARACNAARDAGWGITIHAGEFSGPASIWTAIYQLGANRIGHGFRAVEDPELVDYLSTHGIPLELCPTSNLRLGIVRSWREHPLRTLFDHGVHVTLNSDDPILLGATLSDEFEAAQREQGFQDADLERMTGYAANGAFHRDVALAAVGTPAATP